MWVYIHTPVLYSGVHCVPQKDIVHVLNLRTCECDLIWKTVFADVIKLSIWRSAPPRFRVHLKSSDWCPYNRKAERDLSHTETGRRPRENRDRGVATSQATPGATGTWKRRGRSLLSSLRRESGPAEILITDFWPPELGENKYILF